MRNTEIRKGTRVVVTFADGREVTGRVLRRMTANGRSFARVVLSEPKAPVFALDFSIEDVRKVAAA